MRDMIITKINGCIEAIETFIKLADYDMANYYQGVLYGMVQIAFESKTIDFSEYDKYLSKSINYLHKIYTLKMEDM